MTTTTTPNELPRGIPEAVGMSGEGLAQISNVVQGFIDAGKIQGAVVGVSRRGKVVYFKAQGVSDLDTGAPMQEDNLFHMASSTKPVLGVAAMMMIEEGLFKPIDAVQTYIPEFRDIKVAVLKDPADKDISPEFVLKDNIPAHRLVDVHRPVTIRDLLTHTSGLASFGLGEAVSTWKWPPDEADTLASWIPKVAAGPLDFQPGSRWMYSGTVGLDVVARIIEIVSGTPFNALVQERIFDPLDMKDTHWNIPEDKIPRLVVIRGDKGNWRKPTRYFSGSIGLISSPRDYLHFEQMLLNGGTLFGNRLLSPGSVALMSSNQVGDLYREKGDTKGVGFGYTVSITLDPDRAKSTRSAGAFGWGGAAGTMSWTEPKEALTAVIMVQQPTIDLPNDVSQAIREAIVD
ncbi:MAG: serine hydrolase domain-containing protein [Desulfobacterales bacterium]